MNKILIEEAMKLALETLGQLWLFSDEAAVIANPAIASLREALANEALERMAENARELELDYEPAQRIWVGLTDKEEVELWESTDSDWELMKRTEAKLREKNL